MHRDPHDSCCEVADFKIGCDVIESLAGIGVLAKPSERAGESF